MYAGFSLIYTLGSIWCGSTHDLGSVHSSGLKKVTFAELSATTQ